MTNSEFSNEFDVLFNNIMSNQAPGLDEYEKSVFLTKAQEDIILEIYTGAFETTEQSRRALDSLVKTVNLSPSQYPPENSTFDDIYALNTTHQVFSLPADVWFITYESVLYNESSGCAKDRVAEVIPVTQDYYHRVKNNPFKGPSLKRVLRLDCGNSEVELVSKYKIGTYKLRYMARPRPIVLDSLSSGLSINSETEPTECELHESLHSAILERAVLLAKQAWVNLKAYNNNKE